MQKIVLGICFNILLLALPAFAQTQFTVRVPTEFLEDGKPVSLEMVVFRPPVDGDGPFPTLVFNHGSTGFFSDPSAFAITVEDPVVANFFTARGWLVVFPQRRGRGASDGTYDEGLTKNRSRYSISPSRSLAGLERAMEDIDEVVKYLQASPMVDSNRMLIGGVSRGGILSIVYAGTRPGTFIGAINFVGGWIGQFPGSWFIRFFNDYMKKINTGSFIRGADFGKPTIWLYGDNDSYYSLKHSKENFDAFIAAGGIGTFHSYSLNSDVNGHFLQYYPTVWRKDLEEFLNKVE